MPTPVPASVSETMPIDQFVGLSALLTGIASDKLAPSLDPVNIKQTYFNYIQQQEPAAFAQLLQIYGSNQDEPPAKIADIIFSQSGPHVAFLARSVILAWYLGSWYTPGELERSASGVSHLPLGPSAVISADAYTQGWAWSVAQAHPMGYSNFTFGYWAQNPPTLQDFIGGSAS
jgi:Membrane bound FAD containing D-sorbitol dehydrogenase